MEAGANAAAVPIRDKQKAVFMVSIDSDVGGASSDLLVKKHNTSNLPKGYLQVRILYLSTEFAHDIRVLKEK